jgi:uncharacterized membrane protein
MKKSLLATLAAAITAVFAYVDVAAAATGGSAFKAGQFIGRGLLVVLVVLVVVSIVRRVRARSNTGG